MEINSDNKMKNHSYCTENIFYGKFKFQPAFRHIVVLVWIAINTPQMTLLLRPNCNLRLYCSFFEVTKPLLTNSFFRRRNVSTGVGRPLYLHLYISLSLQVEPTNADDTPLSGNPVCYINCAQSVRIAFIKIHM